MTTVPTINRPDMFVPTPNDASSIVSDQISAMMEAGQDAIVSATSAIEAISTGLADIGAMHVEAIATPDFNLDTDISEEFNPEISNPLDRMGGTQHTNVDISYEPAPINTKEFPDFSAQEPVMNVPDRPPSKPGAPPEYEGNTQPVSLPEAPAIEVNQILATIKGMIGTGQPPIGAPQYTPANFADTSTGLDIQNPLESYTQRLFSFNEPLSDTELTSYLISDIALSLTSGGRGLDGDAENAIYARAKDRINDEYVAEYKRAEAQLAAAGWVIPTGSASTALSDLAARHLRAVEQLNYEVMIENGRLALQDRANAREISARFEQVYREYLSGYYSRLLEGQKQLVSENLELFKMTVEHNKLLIDEFGARVELYKAFVQSSFAELEAFEKQLASYKIQADIRGQDAQLITTWVSTALASVQVYEAQVQGALAVMQNNKIAAEIYGEKIKAHATKVQAYATEVDAWSTEVDAAAKQIDIYTAKAQAYAATASAIESANRTEISKAEIDIKRADLALQKFKAQLEERLGELQVASEYAKVEAIVAGAKGDIAVAKINAKGSALNAQAQVAKTSADLNVSRAELAQETNKVNAANQLAQAQIRVEALKGAAAASAQLAAGILSAINVGATISNGYSVGKSSDYSYRESLTNSLSENISPTS